MNKKISFILIGILLLSLLTFASCKDSGKTPDSTKAPSTQSGATSTAGATSGATSGATEAATSTPESTPTDAPTPTQTPAFSVEPKLVDDKYYINYVTDGLVALYAGKYNTADGLNTESTVWADLSGNGHHITDLVLNENCSFSDKGFYVNTQQIFMPDEILKTVNGNAFTVEMRITDHESLGTTFNTFLNSSGNDNFAFFTRDNNFIEFKANTNNRIKVDGGVEYIENQLLSLTFDLDEGEAYLYCDGEEIGSCSISVAIEAAGQMFIGHPESSRNYSANYVELRFYNRALTEKEIAFNAAVKTGITPKTEG